MGTVPGMTSDLMARMLPHLTLYTNVDPDVATTDPVVAAALGAPRARPLRQDSGDMLQVVVVHLLARIPHGSAFAERATVRTNSLGDVRRFEILARQPVATPR
jgi:general secretion pathway protein K